MSTQPDATHQPDAPHQPDAGNQPDVIDGLTGIAPGSALAAVRAGREQARTQAQRSFAVLLEPADPGSFSVAERWAVAAFTAGLHGFAPAVALYRDGLVQRAPELAIAVEDAVGSGAASGPYGRYREAGLAAESLTGPVWQPAPELAEALGPRLAAALSHSHLLVLRPRESSPRALAALVTAGWDADGIVSLSQLVSFLTFQVRAAAGLRALLVEPAPSRGAGPSVRPHRGGSDAAPSGAVTASEPGATHPGAEPEPVTAPSRPDADSDTPGPLTGTRPATRPERFTQEPLGWVPWLQPLEQSELQPHHHEALIEPQRAAMPYFRLLARDPDALLARTLTDLDIFANPVGGVGRAERELAAAATSRRNGCVFCASVHAGLATRESGRREDVQRLLDDGVDADLGDPRWQAVVSAAGALAATPTAFGPTDVARLRAAGFGDAEVVDLVYASAFFHWANRLMLSLGEPEVPSRRARR